MSISYRHIFLIIGFVLTNLSFFYFGRNEDRYSVIFIIGLVLTLVSFCFIIFKRDRLRNKVMWVTVALIFLALQQILEPVLITKSYSNFISDNKNILSVSNQLIGSKNTDITIYQDPYLGWASKDLSHTETEKLGKILNSDILWIYKDDSKIFYCTYSMLDVQNGVYYFLTDKKPDNRYKHIFGQWYY